MKVIARSLVVIFVVLIAVPALAVSYTITTVVQLLAVTGFYMGGTQHPLSTPPDTPAFITDYMNLADKNYIVPATGVAPTTRIPVVYPAEFAPFSPAFSTTTFDDSVQVGRDNLDSCLRGGDCNGGDPVPRAPEDTFDVYGYSQSAVVAALAKQDLMDDPGDAPADTNIFLVADPMRPNGGILARGFEGMTIPFFGITFYGPAPTNSCDVGECLDTVDVAQQYDFLGGDAPARPDPIAFANSFAAYGLLHGDVPNRTIDGSDPQVISQGSFGDTDYYLITAPQLPLLMLFTQAGVPPAALALPDAILRVWIEDKYRRDLSPGEHVQFQLIPIGNPISLIGNTLGAVPVGIDDTVAQGTGDPNNRPLGTANVYRPFGVGGPVYDANGAPAQDNVGVPNDGGLNLLNAQQPQQLTAATDPKSEPDATKLTNDETQQSNSLPDIMKPPRPLQMIRESLKFDPQDKPSATGPTGDGPLKKIVNALTGQRPKADTESGGDEKSTDAAA